MARGSHPNSLGNLTHEGRPLEYGEPKKSRRLSVTETGWLSARKVVSSMGMSVSEFVEKLGRGQVTVVPTHELEQFEDAIDSALLRQAVAESSDEFVSPEEVLSDRGLTQADVNE